MPIDCGCCPLQIQRCAVSAAPGFFGRLTNVAGNRTAGPGANQFTFTNFAGSGVNVTVQTVGDTLANAAGPQEAGTLAIGVSPPADVQVLVTFSQPVYLRQFGVSDLDGTDSETVHTFAPTETGVYGQKVFVPVTVCSGASIAANPLGNVADTVANGTGGVTFSGPLTSGLVFTYSRCAVAGLGAFLTELAFDTVNPRTVITLFRCPDGDLFYNTAGDVVDPDDYIDCVDSPPSVSDLRFVGSTFNDAANEFICNVVPLPTATTGFTAVGTCYDPSVGAPTMSWVGLPISTVEMEYGSAAGASGGVNIVFNSLAGGTYNWTTNGAQMAIGETRVSGSDTLGRRLALTYVSGPAAASPSGTIRMTGGGVLNIHALNTSITAPIRWRMQVLGQ